MVEGDLGGYCRVKEERMQRGGDETEVTDVGAWELMKDGWN